MYVTWIFTVDPNILGSVFGDEKTMNSANTWKIHQAYADESWGLSGTVQPLKRPGEIVVYGATKTHIFLGGV